MNPHNHAVSHAGNSMSRHTVFDGIDLMFLDVKQETIQFYAKSHTKTFAINHCEEGRIECKFTSGDYLYMGPGDMSIGWHLMLIINMRTTSLQSSLKGLYYS